MGNTAPFHSHRTKIAHAAKLLMSGPRIIAEFQGNVTPPCIRIRIEVTVQSNNRQPTQMSGRIIKVQAKSVRVLPT